MLQFFIRRLLHGVFVLCAISLIAFAIQDNLGDPLRELVGQSVSEAEREALRDELGLNDPFWVQYGRFVGNALRGDLGTSYFFKEPALDVILEKLPATIELVLCASVLILGISVPCGMFAAVRPRHWLSRSAMGLSILGISVPVFLTGILLIYLFSVELNWLPSYGRGLTRPLLLGWETGLLTADGWLHLLLPSVTLASIMLPLFIRLIRAEMLEVLDTEFVRFAWAKGLRPGRIWWVHAFRNTLLPVITVGGVQLGTMVAYTILTETVFQWPGVGLLFLEAVTRADTPLITAYLLVVGVVFVVTNAAVDLLYGLVNPQVKLAQVGAA